MIRNYFKIAFRNLWKYKAFSFINIAGLAIGIACCLLIALYVLDEISYDRYHKNADRIHRVVKDFVNDDGTKLPDATTPPAIGEAIQREIPEIEKMVRIFPGWGSKRLIRYGEKSFYEERFYRADSSLFDVFSFEFVRGNPATALKPRQAMVITESVAKKYFGNEDPIGKSIEVMGDGAPWTITAVLKDIPENSHFHFDFLVPLRFYNDDTSLVDLGSQWGWYNFYTYVKIRENASIASVESKIKAIFKKNQPENTNVFYTQPLTSLHLNSNLKWELEPNSDRMYVYIFLTIGIFVLLIACINYINLSTARSSLRAKEIGVRKVSGAIRSSLVLQFLVESILVALLAAILGIAIAQLMLPAVNIVTQKQLVLLNPVQSGLLLITSVLAIFIGMLAGIYPSLYLSSFKPVFVLKGITTGGKNILNLRKTLVVLQFTISVVLIIGTLIVSRQIDFAQHAKLGLNKDQVLIIPDIWPLSASTKTTLKNNFQQISGVSGVAFADGVVGGQNWTNGLSVKGSENGQLVNFLSVDYDFLDLLDIKISEGRKFSPEFPADTATYASNGQLDQTFGSIILNEKAVKDLGIKSPAPGQLIVWGNDGDTTYYLRLAGVVKDFHFTSMRNDIKPFAFIMNNNRRGNFHVKLSGGDIKKTIAIIESEWKKVAPERPFQYSFLDETFSKLYKSEQTLRTVCGWITGLAIIIACLGLFGLALFMTEQRTREIGIRKVLGATASAITALLSKDFLKLVLIAVLIAAPIAWWAMNKWLQDFAYRINIGWWVFVVAGFIALVIALVTVGLQAFKAAMANPVKSLRTE